MTPKQLRAISAEGGWSAVEELAYLPSCTEVCGDCIATIIVENYPIIRAINPRTWVKNTNSPDLEFHFSFQSYTTQRAE